VASRTKAPAILLQMNPRVSAEFTQDGARALQAVEERTGKWFFFEGSEGLPLEHFAVLLEGERDQMLERALPFRPGEEVHVDIVEPHMYSPGDAVAKVDGYVIEVRGGTPYVGEKRLVRIEDAGRTSAVASLVDVPSESDGSSGKAKPSDSGKAKPSDSGKAKPSDTADPSSEKGDASSENGDSLESRRPRRGRRGGRRRPTAGAGSASGSRASE
jgi:ribonuclease G